jgi:hypothetical protein
MTSASPPKPDPIPDTARAALRQMAAALAYRAAKALADAPPNFADFAISPRSRTARQIVAHMADLMEWGVAFTHGEHRWRAGGSDDWDREVERFFAGLGELDRRLAAPGEFTGSIEKIIQGPLADALTHVGQLTMMRGAAGAPVRPESYSRAEIVAGRVGREQAAPRAEFDGDASAVQRAPPESTG